MTSVDQLRVKIFADGADFDGMVKLYANPHVRGFTTNPSLMRKAGVADYEAFARKVLKAIPDRPVSLEVFADDFDDMERQALAIASWGPNVNVKIPVTNTRGEFAGPLIKRLSDAGVVVNVTAIFTLEQVRRVVDALNPQTAAIVSVFAGRIADTGIDPVPVMRECVAILKSKPKSELIWASPREVLNIVQAHEIGCHIITVTPDMISKLGLLGKDHQKYSLETVEMFYRDATAAGYSIATAASGARPRVAAS
jgi:transaldolase